MRQKIAYIVMCSLAVSIILASLALSKGQTSPYSDLELSILTAKPTFMLGEIVPYEITIANRGSRSIYLRGESISAIAIEVSSSSNQVFKRYIGPDTGFSVDGIREGTEILPKKSHTIRGNIFWNRKPQVSHLSGDVARSQSQDRILTDLVFTQAGIYSVKARLEITDASGGHRYIEAPSIQIVQGDAMGDDLVAWNLINKRPDLAYFLQTAEIPRSVADSSAKESFINDMKRLRSELVNTLVGAQISASIALHEQNNKERHIRKTH